MRIVVTGANGFVGQHLVTELEKRGIRPVRWVFGAADGLSTGAGSTRQLDLRDVSQVGEALRADAPERVVHLAARADVGASFSALEPVWRLNVLATMGLAAALREYNSAAGLVFASSGDSYGATFVDHQPVQEEHPLRPLNPYSASKAAAEVGLEQLRTSGGLALRIIRSFNCAGPGQASGFVVSDFARQVAEIKTGQGEAKISVGNLEAKRDFLDVRDAARGYADVAMLPAETFSGPPVNLCSGKSRSIQSVLDGLLALADQPIAIEVDPERLRPSDIPVAQGSYSRLHSLCGWQPERPFDQTLRDALADWLARSSAG
ncbi:MAG: GDP-mannose 4,6-dehydratase [Pseudomonadota bacterium]